MNPLLIVAGVVAIAYLSTLGRVAKAAANLKYKLKKIQIYQVFPDLKLRFTLSLTNLEKTQITIQQIYLDIYLRVGDKEQRLGTLNTENQVITIPALQTTERQFIIEISYASLGISLFNVLSPLLSGGQVKWPSEVRVEGRIKAENINININERVPLES